ncbi:MAG TPA: ATP-dependent DNA helicase RecG [Solimonas sp.]|nr:ATP-dependent DNA helicase RecG [Solimonas sp.]
MSTERRFVGKKPALTLATEATFLKGAGPAVAMRLRALGIERVQDLLFHLPLRYEDRRQLVPLLQLRDGEDALVRAKVLHAEVRFAGRRSLRVLVDDGTASMLLRFFHFNEQQREAFGAGRWVQAYGTARHGAQGLEMVHPEYRIADAIGQFTVEAGLTPVYPQTTGITQARLRALIQQALDIAAIDLQFNRTLPRLAAPETLAALRVIHLPQDQRDATLLLAGTHPAQTRLIREELLAHQLCMRLLRAQVKARPAPRIAGLADATRELEAVLPFKLTGAQQRVLGQIGPDLAAERPMLRLVQGDVGSGKTVVAAAAMLATVRAGRQAALMAPTELLAEQHHLTLSRWFEPLGQRVEMLAGKLKKAQREAAQARVAAGESQLVVGTHAVFQTAVSFKDLALAVVDEQHRFGVQQRLALRDKGAGGSAPHQLIMSATPIPRTLAQTVYADLDVSVIDQLPPGRTPVMTVAMSNQRRAQVLARIGEACAAGRQAYWVCTLVEESDKLEAQAAEETAARLRAELPQLQVGLVHGRMKPDEKDAQMRAFKDGITQLLVATTVIEVGVDVPRASIMVIDDAERLGLSQLHQLRGRVGRGSDESQCLLLYQPPLSDTARARLEILRATNDGFAIAQKDLELRGPGEILGRRQTGLIGMKLADPVRDSAVIPPLQRLADEWLRSEPELARLLIARWVGDVEKYAQV